ncbi:MAG: hypothetical protein HN576_06765 [Bacteriovoracaceae bacterium]|jgi:hypothetical protein|nr:hypothetical protein [Bacteriovoracaceae bacterium]
MTNKQDDKFNEKDLTCLFKQAKSEFQMDANPFIKTRILAELNSAKPISFLSFLKKPWVIFTEGILVASLLFVIISVNKSSNFQAMVGQAYAINVELEKITDQSVTHIKIDLPENVEFYSKRNDSNVSKLKSLKISLSTFEAFDRIPFVIKAKENGLKTIKITLFNNKEEIVKNKIIKMKFTTAKEIFF